MLDFKSIINSIPIIAKSAGSDVAENIEELDFFGKNDQYDGFYSAIQDERRKNEELKQVLDQKKAEHELRMATFKKLFLLMVAWLSLVLAIVVLSGVSRLSPFSFELSDNVIMTLLGTTTLNIFGIFAIAVGWLFPKK